MRLQMPVGGFSRMRTDIEECEDLRKQEATLLGTPGCGLELWEGYFPSMFPS